MSFFSSCKHLSNGGRTIFLVTHSDAFDEIMLTRLRSMSDAHLRLNVVPVGPKLVKSLEVRKVHNAMLTTGNVIPFEVEPGMGMRIIPLSLAKA